jgi:outer membrane protein OmpA-like peptidoglycan-associated protein
MATPSTPPDHRNRRAVLQQGAGALVTLFLVGALVMKPRIQSGLEDEARSALDAAGIPATVDFVFQDGRILCVDQLDDPDAARRLVLEVRGVRSATLDPICVDGPPSDTDSSVSTTTAPDTTAPDTTAPDTTAADTTTIEATTTVPSTTTTIEAPADTGAGVTPPLGSRPVATPKDATDVEAAINALVSATPILFGKGDVVISAQSFSTLEQIAGIVTRFVGLSIEVQGHTDGEGDPGRNLTLSEERAKAVADALVARGVPADEVTSKGFGETQLIRDENGAEIPDKSRRVVFAVTTAN